MANLQLTQEKLDALRSEYRPRRPCAQLKYPRPKTKPEYQAIYPWLLPDETDPHFVFCAVCECRLSCKRSDLGKHEGSIKHSENAQRKSLVPKIEEDAVAASGIMNWEYTDEQEGLMLYGAAHEKKEHDDEDGDDEADGDGDADAEVDDDDTDPNGEGEADADADVDAQSDNDNETEPASKQQRRISESDSQHSGMLDYLPLHVTINELPSQLLPGTPFPSAATVPQPCRITIKKVSAPVAQMAAPSPPPNVAQSHEITSKATITPLAASGSCYTPSTRLPQSYASRQLQSYQLQNLSSIAPPRDSLELFFDSICSTVKSLPPKLATEGKIRVMQLIGELELRALSDQDCPLATQPSLDLATCAPPTPDTPVSSQQNATVASTTK
ncbi:bifunctional lysine-specific demethylase and histidyl-hydroxylase NO66 [Drosophila miranda]|uniref:bifunctional lysine-specific demethylase and histidyl-hydroxylase NO66 n=1 Tax=Drosophila miranda TaxID=7229 RepID=UPI0007E65E25|nr:bifunctional lysine-specific demethylase and histidyl-hydroxylase NO66 [Drosophila miranda]